MNVLTVFHLFLVLQTLVSSTAELTDLEISGLQEELAGFIMDQVLIMDDLMLVYILKTIYVAVVGFAVWICVFVVMFVWIQYIVSVYRCCWRCKP